MSGISVIVPGSLNTDLIGMQVERIPGPGELVTGKEFAIGPGGKSRNIAQMAAALLGKGKVAMIGRTARDKHGLWQPPYDALKQAGVDTGHIKFSDSGFPGIALIPVDREGRNQIYILPGANKDFSPEDIKDASGLFKEAGKNSGVMAMSLEMPRETAVAAVGAANKNGLKVILDPGGINEQDNNAWILEQELFLLKPNEHEAKILSGTKVRDFKGAAVAARKMLRPNIRNVLITAGKDGAYLFNKEGSRHLPAPAVKAGKVLDETGCGDQVTAVLAALTGQGKDIGEASRLAVLAGTMQFYRQGISPVTGTELKEQEL